MNRLRSSAPSLRHTNHGHASGFTLIELVMVIIILGVLGGLTVNILLQPFLAFQDQSRRAAMVAEADLVLGRMVRELRMALPNSVRINDNNDNYLEFIPVVDGGRYRARQDMTDPDNPSGDALDFSNLDTRFDVLGGFLTGRAAAGDFLVIYNVSANDSTANGNIANAYAGDNRTEIIAVGLNPATLQFESFQFPYPSLGAQRFDVVPASGPVSYYCDGNQLFRATGYGYAATQPTAFDPENTRLLASNVTRCAFGYEWGGTMRNGVVTLQLAFEEDGETISLLYQAQVVNSP